MQRRHARLIAVVCMLCGCNAVTESTFEPEYVVESYLVASAPLPEILLSHSAPINVYQAFTDLGVSGAMMRLSLLTSAGTIEKSYPYTESRKARGVYLPLSTDLVLPTRTYLLEAYVPEGDIDIRARTSIPDTFSIRSYNKSEVLYQDREKVWLTMSRSRSDLPEPVYITSNMAIDNVVENLVPSQKSLYELSRGSIHLVSLRDVEGPLTLESRMEHSGG